MTESWWLKLQRADRHLKEASRYISAYERRKNVYRPRRTPNAKGKQHVWRYVLEMTQEPNKWLPLAVGDMVHNMRSSLDHILVAMRPRKYRYNRGFPVLTEDPWSGPITRGKRALQQEFAESVAGMGDGAVRAIKKLQPYMDRKEGRDPDHNALRVIGRLDNADKHRERIIVVPGLINVETTITARGEILVQRHKQEPGAYPGLVEDGTEVAHFKWTKSPPLTEAEVTVDVCGTPFVSLDVGIKDGYMAARDTLSIALGWLSDHVIPVLEQFVPDGT